MSTQPRRASKDTHARLNRHVRVVRVSLGAFDLPRAAACVALFAAAWSLLCFTSTVSHAQPAAAATGTPASSAATLQPPSAPASNPDALAVLTRSLERTRALRTYQDVLLHTFELRATMGASGSPTPPQPVDESVTQQARLVFAGEGVALTGTPLELVTDRRTLWLIDTDARTYIERSLLPPTSAPTPAPTTTPASAPAAPTTAPLDWKVAAAEFADLARAHPVLEVLEGLANSGTGFPGIDFALRVADDNINGIPARRVEGRGRPGAMDIDPASDGGGGGGAGNGGGGGARRSPAAAEPPPLADVRAWFNTQTGLLMKYEVDLRPVYEQAFAGAPASARLNVQSATITMVFADVKADAAIEPSAFVFKPAPTDRKVEAFLSGFDDPTLDLDPRSLIGRPAPILNTSLLGGGEINLASLRAGGSGARDTEGWHVVLCFWAATCQPCGPVLDQLNTVVDRYPTRPDPAKPGAAKPGAGDPAGDSQPDAAAGAARGKGGGGRRVMVLGVNQDPVAALERTRKFVNDRGLKMRHALDPGGTSGRDFGASRLPLVVVIGPDGVVRNVLVGGDADPATIAQRVIDSIELRK